VSHGRRQRIGSVPSEIGSMLVRRGTCVIEPLWLCLHFHGQAMSMGSVMMHLPQNSQLTCRNGGFQQFMLINSLISFDETWSTQRPMQNGRLWILPSLQPSARCFVSV
jgi:hypothetical protein